MEKALWTCKGPKTPSLGPGKGTKVCRARAGSQRSKEIRYMGDGEKQEKRTQTAITEVQQVSFPLTGRLKDLKWNRPLPYLLRKTK